MPYGIPNYGAPEEEQMGAPPQLTSIMSPGQPTKGKFNWKTGAGLAIAAPLVAMLASKMSGGAVNMSDALASMGGGFLDQKLTQAKEKRHQGLQEENRMMDLAHDSVKGLSNLPPETIAKFPKLQSLSQKYQDALANDGKISPKEAGEIVTQYQMAVADMALAQKEQRTSTALQSAGDLQRQNIDIARQGKVADLAMGMAQPPQDMGNDEANYILGGNQDRAARMLGENELATLERSTPQKFSVDGQEMMLSPSEYLNFMGRRETERHNKELEELRARTAGKGAAAQERAAALAEFAADSAEWNQMKQLVLSEFNQDSDPVEKQQALAAFLQANPQPRKSDYIGGKKGKLDRSVLDSTISKYVKPSSGSPGSGNPLGLTPPPGMAPGSGVLR